MLNAKDKGVLLSIIKRCNRIETKINNITQEEFNFNDDVKEVVCFNLFQIGELANALSIDCIQTYSDIPWKYIVGMRNRIVHGYQSINLEIVWNTAKESIGLLKEECLKIINNDFINI